MNSVTGSALKLGRQALASALVYLMIPLGVGDVLAQNAPPPPPPDQQAPQDQGQDQSQGGGAPQQNYNALSDDQLNQLVAPIALYPDSLVAQVLAAATFPTEVVDADRFVQAHPGVAPDQLGPMVDGMQWDPSVKALIAFPSVLSNLDKNLDWTSQLGNAYFNQPQDVMSAVQVMRQRAYDAGNLKTNQQLSVAYQPNNIVIAPANPTVVYVPYYNPWGVYGAPIVAWGGYYPPPPPIGYGFGVGLAIGFGVGIAIGSWNHYGWGWHNWGVGWGSRTVVYNRNVYVSRSVTVINHGNYGHYDRNVAARNYNRNIAAHAPNYRPGYNGGYNNNRPGGGNNYNRPGNNARPVNNNNFNRPGGNNNYNRPGNVNNGRPAGDNNYNRPNNNDRPANNNQRPTNNNNARPTNNARPANTNAGRPANNSHPAPQSRPAAQSRPAPQSHPSGGHPSEGHPSGGKPR
jgi:Protein of unknown function (DUF3300)